MWLQILESGFVRFYGCKESQIIVAQKGSVILFLSLQSTMAGKAQRNRSHDINNRLHAVC